MVGSCCRGYHNCIFTLKKKKGIHEKSLNWCEMSKRKDNKIHNRYVITRGADGVCVEKVRSDPLECVIKISILSSPPTLTSIEPINADLCKFSQSSAFISWWGVFFSNDCASWFLTVQHRTRRQQKRNCHMTLQHHFTSVAFSSPS